MSVDEQKCLAVCLDCGDGDLLPMPFTTHAGRDEWALAHSQATAHAVVGIEGWPRPDEVKAIVTSYP